MCIKYQIRVYGVLHLWLYNSVFAPDVTDLSSAMLDAWRLLIRNSHRHGSCSYGTAVTKRFRIESHLRDSIPLSNHAKSLECIVKKRCIDNGGGALPFLVGGVICLVNSVNERDFDLLNSQTILESLSTS